MTQIRYMYIEPRGTLCLYISNESNKSIFGRIQPVGSTSGIEFPSIQSPNLQSETLNHELSNTYTYLDIDRYKLNNHTWFCFRYYEKLV